MNKKKEFDNIVDTFAGNIFNHAFRMLGSREDAEEATQDVFIKIHRGLNGFRGEAKVSTWIWKITANVCISYLNKRKRNNVYVPLEDEKTIVVDSADMQSPEEHFIYDENRTGIIALISKLDPVVASVITLFYIDEKSYKEISNILELPMGTVATHLHRGRENLKQLMQNKKE